MELNANHLICHCCFPIYAFSICIHLVTEQLRQKHRHMRNTNSLYLQSYLRLRYCLVLPCSPASMLVGCEVAHKPIALFFLYNTEVKRLKTGNVKSDLESPSMWESTGIKEKPQHHLWASTSLQIKRETKSFLIYESNTFTAWNLMSMNHDR